MSESAFSETVWVSRSVSLRESGFTQPLSFNSKIRERHFYLPIAQNANVKEVVLELDATYLRQFVSTDGLTVLINGVPTRSLSLAQGASPSFLKMTSLDGTPVSLDTASELNSHLTLQIPLTNLDPSARFVDVGVSFNSKSEAERCTDIQGRANELLINPNTALRYRFDRRSVTDVRSFLTTLPKQANILLPSHITPVQYEAALRLSMGLRHQGVEPRLETFPVLGDSVAVSHLKIPDALRKSSMFADLANALEQQTPFTLKTERDLAAWLVLRLAAQNGLADVIVDSAEVRAALLQSGALWRTQASLADLPKAAFQALEWAARPVATPANLSIVNWADAQILLLDAPQQTPAALLAGSFWAEIANGAELNVNQALPLTTESQAHRLMIAHNLPVQYLQGEVHWEVPFGAKDLPNGERPNALQLNILSAHRKGDTPAVVSVYMNDFLLTAKDLREDGEVTAVSAFVPLYTLKANNVVRIEVIDTAQKNCASSQPLPVQVLPSSFLGLGGASDVSEFFSLLPHLTQASAVLIPPSYLQNASDSLPTVSHVLQGLAMTASGFKVEFASGKEFIPQGAFVSFEVAPKGLPSLVETNLNQLVVRDKNHEVIFDSKGLGSLAVVQIIGAQGVLVSRVGQGALNLVTPIELSTGNLVVMDRQGVKLVLNSNDPQQEFSLNESGRGLVYLVERYHLPFVIAGSVLFIALIMLTFRLGMKAVRRRSDRRNADRRST
ncbi:MAG: hypothetical protein ACXW1C_04145 [Gallionella sp.]